MNASSNIERFDEALLERLTSKGFKIFPCRADKSPATPHGFHDATSNFAEARELFDRHRGPYIGVATGEVGFIGLGVMDMPIAPNPVRNGFDVTADDVETAKIERLVGLGAARLRARSRRHRTAATHALAIFLG